MRFYKEAVLPNEFILVAGVLPHNCYLLMINLLLISKLVAITSQVNETTIHNKHIYLNIYSSIILFTDYFNEFLKRRQYKGLFVTF